MTTGINVSTAHRLLQTLARRHYIEQNQETRAYTLGPRLFELGSAYARNMDLVGVSQAFHRAVARRDGRDGSSCDPQRPRSGGGLHRHRQSDGYGVARHRAARSCVLHGDRQGHARLPDTGRTGSVFRGAARCRRRRRKSITEPALLVAELARVRANGFALDEQELSEDVCCVGAPIRNGPDRVIAAISVAMPKARFRQDKVPEWTRLLVETAERISSVIRLSSAG